MLLIISCPAISFDSVIIPCHLNIILFAMPYHVTQCYISWCLFFSCNVVSCHLIHVMLCHFLLSFMSSCVVLSQLLPLHLISFHNFSCISCRASSSCSVIFMSCQIMPGHASIPCHFTSCHFMPYHALPSHLKSWDTMSHFMPWHIVMLYVMTFHVISSYVMSCQLQHQRRQWILPCRPIKMEEAL